MLNVPRLVGMIHLPPFPGSCSWNGESLPEIIDLTCADAATLEAAGFDSVLVQNTLDRPTRERLDSLTVAQFAVVAAQIVESTSIPVGVNAIKNDGPGAIAVAAAAGAQFVRVKVLTGAVLSAEGIVTGCASQTHEMRSRLHSSLRIWADVYEPTSRPLVPDDFDRAVTDARDFGMADAVIVTGPDALQSCLLAESVRSQSCPVVIGGGIDESTVGRALEVADSVIIGRNLKVTGELKGRASFERAQQIVEAANNQVTGLNGSDDR